MNKIENKLTKKANWGLRTFLTALLVASICFLIPIMRGGGIFYYMGDYNAQQIPFYVHSHDMIRNGNFGWDWGTELGSDFFSSYTYYTICSPFFWLTIPFPSSWVPYLMGPLLILKFACAAGTAYLYLQMFTKTKNAASLGAILYSFSGWSIYNIFYNQFHESLIVFPLLLWSLEKLVRENKKGIFALMVMVAGVTNYYFFAGMVVFTIIYWIIRTATKNWQMNFKKFLQIFGEGLLGTIAAIFVLVPSAIAVFSMSRTTGAPMNGTDLFVYNDAKIYLYLIQCMLFPPELPAVQSFIFMPSTAWQSLSLWLPGIGIIGVITWISHNKRHWTSKLLLTALIMMFVPGLNAAFTLLQPVYYARWFLMPLLFMSLVSVRVIEKYNVEDCKKPFMYVSIATVALILMAALTPTYKNNKWQIGFFSRVNPESKSLFLLWSTVALCSIVVLLYVFYKKKQTRLLASIKVIKRIIYGTIICVMTITILICQALESHTPTIMRSYLDCKSLMDNAEGYRIVNIDNSFNYTMLYDNTSNISCFHSVVAGSTGHVYKSLFDRERKVNTPSEFVYLSDAYRAITSVKYELSDDSYLKNYKEIFKSFEKNDKMETEIDTKYKECGASMANGYKEIYSKDNIRVYENEYALSYGIPFNYYVKQEDYDKLSFEDKEVVMLNALVLKEEDVENFKNLTELKTDRLDKSKEAYFNRCQNLQNRTCTDFVKNTNGFKAKFNSKTKDTVMFSIPHEKGWTAMVDGKEVNIYSVDGGFMAINLESGEHNIEFTYTTPMLKESLIVSAIAFTIILVLLALNIRETKAKK